MVERQKMIENILIPTVIGYILTVLFSYYTWVGIIIGPAVAGYLTKRYRYTISNTFIIGITSWPTVFHLKRIIIGETFAKAMNVASFFVNVAILISFIIALLSGILGASINNILTELKLKREVGEEKK